MTFHFSSERLYFRDLQESDVNDIFELDADPEVHRYLGNRPIGTKEEALKTILHVKKQYEDKGIGRWAIVEKRSGECIGWCGFKLENRDWKEGEYYDLGYRLKRRHWGKAYGTEAAGYCLEYGFINLGLKEICAAAHVDNLRSNNILQKLHFQIIKVFEFDDSLHNWYELSRRKFMTDKGEK